MSICFSQGLKTYAKWHFLDYVQDRYRNLPPQNFGTDYHKAQLLIPEGFNNKKQGRQCTYNITLRRVHAIIFAAGKQWILHRLECVLIVFGIHQCAWAILSSVVCYVVQYFSTISHTRYDFLKSFIENKICVWSFSTKFVWKISHSKKKWARYDQKCILIFV